MDRQTFTWEGLYYHVPVPDGQRQLLDNLYGYVKPGTVRNLQEKRFRRFKLDFLSLLH
jgi:hypothetical protein